MRTTDRASLSVLAFLMALGPAAWAQEQPDPPAAGASDERDHALDAQIRAEVAAASEKAAKLMDQAYELSAGDPEKALTLYLEAVALAPAVDHPHRRACHMLVELKRLDEALVQCDEALRLAPGSALDKGALAEALMFRDAPGDVGRALRLAREAASDMPDQESVLGTWCQAAFASENRHELRTCAEKLVALEPKSVNGNVSMAIALSLDGELVGARHYLEKAHDHGMDDRGYKELSDLLDRAETDSGGGRVHFEEEDSGSGFHAPSANLLKGALVATGVWLAVLVALLATGWILSRLTLRTSGQVAAGESSTDGGEHARGLRRIYKVVVVLCGIYFYLSTPILLISVLVVGGGLIWMVVSIGYIPVKLVLITGILVFVTVGAILRGLFARSREVELGYPVDLGANPKFRALLDDVARTIGTRPVDSAYFTPHTDMAVTERGGLWKSLRGKATERCLIVGVGLLDGMKQVELRSVLAHEYGHFRNEDTAGGGFALAVRRSLVTMIIRLAESGAATWYNPVWLFLRAYYKVYLVVSQGASRLQEVLADRWAVRAYGSEAFIRGYTHVVKRSVRFDHHVQLTLRDVLEHERPLPNLYRYQVAAPDAAPAETSDDEREAIREAMEREPSAYDSHPAPRQRIAWAAAMEIERQAEPDDQLPAWELFEQRDELERRMTASVREAVEANHGVAIPE